jgi:hypothetical protein
MVEGLCYTPGSRLITLPSKQARDTNGRSSAIRFATRRGIVGNAKPNIRHDVWSPPLCRKFGLCIAKIESTESFL